MKKNYLFRLAVLLFAVTLGQSVKAQTATQMEGWFGPAVNGSYTIDNDDEWYAIAGLVSEGVDFAGYKFLLTADLGSVNPICEPIGCQENEYDEDGKLKSFVRKRFAGTFDGGGKTINIDLWSYNNEENPNPNYCAPFAYVKNTTIKNLKVTGHIFTEGTFAGGLVGSTGAGTSDGKITIENVEVAVDMECHYLSGDQGSGKYANQAGFVGIAEGSATIKNCWFSGSLSGADFAYSGGFIALNKAQSSLNNCLFAPSSVTAPNVAGSSEFVHTTKDTPNYTLTNCYYTVSFSKPETAQGKKVVDPRDPNLQVDLDDYIKQDVTAADGQLYYILLNNVKWETLQAALASEEVTTGTISVPKTLIAGSADEPLVVRAGNNFTLNMQGFTLNRDLDRVNPATADGYVIKVSEGAELTILNGTICGGHNTGNGGGIYNAGTLTLNKVTVTGNRADGVGGGVYNAGTLKVTDQVQVSDNTSDNVYLPTGKVITVVGTITGSSIGVTAEAGVGTTITSGLGSNDVTCFFSDNAEWYVDVNTTSSEAFLSNATQDPLNLYETYPNNYNSTNTAEIAKLNGKRTNVKLNGRAFKSSVWNTLCLPFDATLGLLKTVLGTGIKVDKLESLSVESGTLNLNFKRLTDDDEVVSAGTPFIVKGSSKNGPTFSGVTVKKTLNNVVGSGASFVGTYERVDFTAGDKSILFMSSNMLYYPGEGNYVNPMRAYFVIGNGSSNQNPIKAFVVDFDDEDDATSIEIVNEVESTTGAIYNLAGQRISKMQKGINIVNGKKILF